MEKPILGRRFLIIGILGAILAVVICSWAWWSASHEEKKTSVQKTEEVNEVNSDEAQKLLDLNQDTIKAASFKKQQSPKIDSSDRVQGEFKAPLSLVVYEDLSQPFAADFDNTLEKAKSRYGVDIVIAYRPFVLGNSLSRSSALVLECAFRDGKGWELRKEILSITKDKRLTEENLAQAYEKVGLKKEDYGKCLADPDLAAKLQEKNVQASDYGVVGTPTVFVGEEMINGARPFEDFTDSNNDRIEGLSTVINRNLKK